jgi:glycine/D-amino acid oxidase-like deaminating enzyme/nitrite reductase/ring-hydroxylating ferredoxin subunit
MKPASLWLDTATAPHFPPLTADLQVDVGVVGGGITGLTAAYLLDREGIKVAVFERRRLFHGESGHTTAHLTCVTDSRLTEFEKRFGRDHAGAVWDAGSAAIIQIEQNIRDCGIECDFRRVPGFLVAALGQDPAREVQSLQDEAKLAAELGFDTCYLDAVPGLNRPGYRIANQAKFHVGKYLSGLAQVLAARGVPIFEESEVTFHETPNRRLVVNGRTVTCNQVVMATHYLQSGFESSLTRDLLQTKIAAYNTYAIGAKIPKGALPEALYWDTNDPYYYLRVERGEESDYVIWGGEDHKTGQVTETESHYDSLERTLRPIVPEMVVDRHWSGQVLETNDGLPFIGWETTNQFRCTGFAGNGMTFGTLSAMMARDAIRGTKNPWQDLFAPDRRTLTPTSVWDYLMENKDYPYYLVKGALSRGEVADLGEIASGQGKVVALEGKKVAVYRQEDGTLLRLSPVCPHLGCTVAWNESERTWDCPCHGSRFSGCGKVINGPAETPLAPLPH